MRFNVTHGGDIMSFYSKVVNGLKFVCNKDFRWCYLANQGKFDSLDDEIFLKRKYKAYVGRELNLDNPQTFNEKLQWLKLYDRKPEYTMMVDKYAVRNYIADTIGEEYLIPLLGVWEDPDEIDFDKLPDKFVLKCNHNSGLGMYICKNKSEMNIKEVKNNLKRGLQQDYYLSEREWPYKNVPRKIICEKYMQNNNDECLTDYKFFCFNGEPRLVLICKGDASKGERTNDFYDINFKHLPVILTYPNANEEFSKPNKFDEMLLIARKLSFQIPHLRVDLYVINGKIYFGETTFFHDAGLCKFNPPEWDKYLGDMLDLPAVKE